MADMLCTRGLLCVVAGYPKEEKSWAYPHLCQQMDGVFSRWQGTSHKLRAKDSMTSTLHSTFTSKSLTASTIKTCDTLSRGRAGSQEVDFAGMNMGVSSSSSNVNSHSGLNMNVNSSDTECQGGLNMGAVNSSDVNSANVNSHGAYLCKLNYHQVNGVAAGLDRGADNVVNDGSVNTTSVNRFSGCANSTEGNEVEKLRRRECTSALHKMETSDRNAVAIGTCLHCQRQLSTLTNKCTEDGEWLEINDERKAWQLEGEERRGQTSQQQELAAGALQREDATQPSSLTAQGFSPFVNSLHDPSKDQGVDTVSKKHDTKELLEKWDAPTWDGEKQDANRQGVCSGCGTGLRDSDSAGYGTGGREGGLCPQALVCDDPSPGDDQHGDRAVLSKDRVVAVDSQERRTASAPATGSSSADASQSFNREGGRGLPLSQSLGLCQIGGLFSGDVFPQNLLPLNSGNPSHRYHYHNPPLLQNPHPHPPPQAQAPGARGQPVGGPRGLHDQRQQPSPRGAARGDQEERRSQRSFHSSRNGESSSDGDDLSILNGLESGGSSSGGWCVR